MHYLETSTSKVRISYLATNYKFQTQQNTIQQKKKKKLNSAISELPIEK